MKILPAVVAFLLLIACHTQNNTSTVYTITKIQPEKDGQTLFLKTDQGAVYTTIISIPNGNFIKVHEGDKITMDIQDTLKMNPPAFISKNIKILEAK